MDRLLVGTFKLIALVAAIVFTVILRPSPTVQAAPAATQKDRHPGEPAEKTKGTKALRRLDFRIQGRSCVTCLLSIEKRMRHAAGTVKAVVQLKVPYGAVVIYDGAVTSKGKVFKAAQGNEADARDISFHDITDASVAKAPVVLMPLPFK